MPAAMLATVLLALSSAMVGSMVALHQLADAVLR